MTSEFCSIDLIDADTGDQIEVNPAYVKIIRRVGEQAAIEFSDGTKITTTSTYEVLTRHFRSVLRVPGYNTY